jgi:CheY-like chemotaxis protein
MKGLGCVLVVEDDPVSNYITEKVVKGNNGSTLVTSTTDGLRALDFIRYQCSEEEDSSCPDLIILDINMPKLGGVGFIKKFRELNDIIDELEGYHIAGIELKPLSTDRLQKVIEEISVHS